MTIFSLLESSFFLFLGISFILVLLMVYHFKKKLDTIERKNETLQDICKTICEELDFVKSQTQPPPLKPQNTDPFYLNYHKVYENNCVEQEVFSPIDSDFFKTILVSGGGNSNPDALEIQDYENEELDDVQSYEEDFEYQETDDTTSSSTVEEVDDFGEVEGFAEEIGFFKDVMVHVQKLDAFVMPTYDTYVDSESRVEELGNTNEEEINEEKTETHEDEATLLEEDIEEDIEETLLVKKLEMEEDEDLESKLTSTKASLQKLTLQMLRTMVIKEGLCTDPSKLKKVELIQIVLDSQ